MYLNDGTHTGSILLRVKLLPTSEQTRILQHTEITGRRTLPRVLLNPSDFKRARFVAGQLLRLVVDSPFSLPSVVVAWPSSQLKPARSIILSTPGLESAGLRYRAVMDICLQPVNHVLFAVKVEVEIIEVKKYNQTGSAVLQLTTLAQFHRTFQSALRGIIVAERDIRSISIDNHTVLFCINSLLTSKEVESNRQVKQAVFARVTAQTCVVLESQLRTNGTIECKLPDYEFRREEIANLVERYNSSTALAHSMDAQSAIGILLLGVPRVGKGQARAITRNMHLVCKPSESGLFKFNTERVNYNAPVGCHSFKQFGIVVLNVKQVVGLAALGIAEAHLTLRALFSHVSAIPSTIILLKELDTLSISNFSHVMDMLISCFDNLNGGIIIASCGQAAKTFPTLCQSGRFDRVHTVDLSHTMRFERFSTILQNIKQSYDFPQDLRELASEIAYSTHGLATADLRLIGKISLLFALKSRAQILSVGSFCLYSRNLNCTTFCMKHILQARSEVLSRYRSHVEQNVSPVRWTDLGGLATVKRMLCEIFQCSLLHISTLSQLGIVSSTCGVLLYGPPGCSKTMLARAIATESSMNFLTVLGPELLSMWLGDSERALHAVFLQARATSPAIIFFDEIDSLALRRTNSALPSESAATDRVLAQLLVELDGIASHARICVVAATNRPDLLDPALMRPGRLDYLLYIPPPDYFSRCEILVSSLKRMPIALSCNNFIILQLARCTTLCSGAEIVDICRHAALNAIGDTVVTTQQHAIESRHLFSNLAKLDLSSRSAALRFYEIWQHRVIQ